MKRIIVFVVVGLVMFGAGFGGGLMLGRTMASGNDDSGLWQEAARRRWIDELARDRRSPARARA